MVNPSADWLLLWLFILLLKHIQYVLVIVLFLWCGIKEVVEFHLVVVRRLVVRPVFESSFARVVIAFKHIVRRAIGCWLLRMRSDTLIVV